MLICNEDIVQVFVVIGIHPLSYLLDPSVRHLLLIHNWQNKGRNQKAKETFSVKLTFNDRILFKKSVIKTNELNKSDS